MIYIFEILSAFVTFERVLKFFREVGLTKLCDWVLLGVFSVLRSFRLFLDGFRGVWVFSVVF